MSENSRPESRSGGGGPDPAIRPEHEADERLFDLATGLPDWLESPRPVERRPGSEPARSEERDDPFFVDPREHFPTGPLDRPLPAAASEPIDPSSLLEPSDDIGILGPDLSGAAGHPAPATWDLELTGEDSPEPREDESPEVAEVRLLVQSLVKAVKAARLYPLDSPVASRFAQELVRSFAATFAILDELRLAVGKTRFFFRGEIVLDQPGREESVPGRFFWDGIREITFRKGLTPQEVFDFLGVCRGQQEAEGGGEDDLVTLLWQRQFQHVAYIAVDDILDLENPEDPIPEEFGTEFMNFVDLEMHNLEDEEEVQRVSMEFAEEIRAGLGRAEVDLFGVDPKARELIMSELRVEESPKMVEDILTIILETLYLDTNEASFVETVRIIAGALASLIEEGRLVVAGGLVRMLGELREQRPDLTPAMIEAIDAGINEGWAAPSCDALVRHLNDNIVDVLAGLEDFVGLLPGGATGSLVHVLSRLESPRARRRMVESLTRRARVEIDVFLPYLKDPRPEMIRDVATILGGTLNDRALRPLKELMRHPDVAVRCQALDALTRLGPAKAGDVLLGALFDADPRVRLSAARSLGQAGRVAVPTLLLLVEDKRFNERDFPERKAIFRALGAAGGSDVIPVMERHLRQRSVFRRGQSDEIRACACEALGWIGGPRAEELLREHQGDRSTMVRSAAQAALRRLSGAAPEDDREAA